jgi:mannose-6-phosphate isomerase-like protein (cupin superfamily)
MKSFELQINPFVVPTNEGKLIKEHFGMASIFCGDFSFAHMIAPPGWGELLQTPEFDEATFVFSGREKIEVENETIILETNQSICIKKDSNVKYSNPFQESCEYVSVCIPAFTIDRVKRQKLKN